jgi:small multidrug resistance family-3 protein
VLGALVPPSSPYSSLELAGFSALALNLSLRVRPGPKVKAFYRAQMMDALRSISLFALAAVAEIGGAWLVWQGVREHRGVLFVGAGIVALGAYGFVATLQPDGHFGRVLAAYGGIFVAGSLTWGIVVDRFQPDRYDLAGAVLCLLGVSVIMFAPRGGA